MRADVERLGAEVAASAEQLDAAQITIEQLQANQSRLIVESNALRANLTTAESRSRETAAELRAAQMALESCKSSQAQAISDRQEQVEATGRLEAEKAEMAATLQELQSNLEAECRTHREKQYNHEGNSMLPAPAPVLESQHESVTPKSLRIAAAPSKQHEESIVEVAVDSGHLIGWPVSAGDAVAWGCRCTVSCGQHGVCVLRRSC